MKEKCIKINEVGSQFYSFLFLLSVKATFWQEIMKWTIRKVQSETKPQERK